MLQSSLHCATILHTASSAKCQAVLGAISQDNWYVIIKLPLAKILVRVGSLVVSFYLHQIVVFAASSNGLFPSCCLSQVRSESWCSTIEREMSLIGIRLRN